jgi:uncharacterized cupin superfamily protein
MAEPGVAFTRLDPDTGERFQRLRQELGVTSFGLNLIILQPRERGRVHVHDQQEEVYLVQEGELTLVLEDGERVLGPGEAARVGAEVRRQLVNRGDSRLVMVAIGGHGEHVGRDGRAWESWDEGGPGRPPQEVPLPGDLPPD